MQGETQACQLRPLQSPAWPAWAQGQGMLNECVRSCGEVRPVISPPQESVPKSHVAFPPHSRSVLSAGPGLGRRHAASLWGPET